MVIKLRNKTNLLKVLNSMVLSVKWIFTIIHNTFVGWMKSFSKLFRFKQIKEILMLVCLLF